MILRIGWEKTIQMNERQVSTRIALSLLAVLDSNFKNSITKTTETLPFPSIQSSVNSIVVANGALFAASIPRRHGWWEGNCRLTHGNSYCIV